MSAEMTKKQLGMPVDFTQMSIGEIARALDLLIRMVTDTKKDRDGGVLAEPHAQITVPLMFLARAMGIEYHRSIEVGKIKKTLAEIKESVNALLSFARLMYPDEEITEETGKVRRLPGTGTNGG